MGSVRKKARIAALTRATRETVAERLFSLFTGYHCSRQLVMHVYEAAGFSLQGIADAGGVTDWLEKDLHLLVACFLRVRFPIVVALNKVDVPEAKENIEHACTVLGEACMPISARAEWWLFEQQRRGNLTYVEGAGAESVAILPSASDKVKEQWESLRTRVLHPYGTTGVLDVLTKA